MKKKILVFRFSALGDVAMTVPVLWSFLEKYPEHDIWFVSRPFAANLVAPLPGVHFVSVDFKGRHKGFYGLFRLFRELKKAGPWEAVVDLHSVLRTHVLSLLFKVAGNNVSKIDKGRNEKEALCRKENKVFKKLPATTERYQQTFEKAGFPFKLSGFPGKKLFGIRQPEEKKSSSQYNQPPNNFPTEDLSGFIVGVAPFAKHQWKMWPEDKMHVLLNMLQEHGCKIILFGGPGAEQEKLERWAENLKNASTFAGQLSLSDELKLISQLDVMVSMDSANMHFASLTETRVVSIWGATHPYAGFYGFGQNPDDAVQIDLECRPCSVFGDKPCHRGDFACMMRVSPEMVLEKVLKSEKRKIN